VAVTVLEASAARVVGQYVAVSRIRPQRDLIDLVGAEFCRDHLVVPLWREGASVAVAVARPRATDALRELRERLGQAIAVRLSSPAEILVAIDNALDIDPAVSRRGALAEVLQELRLLRPDQAAAYALAAEDEEYLGQALTEAKLLDDEERLEAVGLAFHLPSVNLRRHAPRAGLDGLFDLATLRRLRVLPLWSTQDELFFACDTPPTAALMEQMDAALGLTLRPVLVAPSELTTLLAGLIDEDAAESVQLIEAARHERLALPAQIEAAERVTRQTGEPLRSTLHRLAGITPEALQEALARTSGLRVFRDEIVQDEVTTFIPLALARRLRALPVNRDGRRIVVAMENPWDVRTRRGLGALLDAEVQPAIVDATVLDALLARAAEHPPRRSLPIGHPHRTALILLQAGFVDPNLAVLADMDLGSVSEQTLPRLWDAMDDGLRSDAVTLDAGVPRVERLLLHPQPDASAARPRTASDPPLLPLIEDTEVLTVAVSSPDAIEAARLFASARQCALRPAIAREDRLQEALADLGSLDLRTLSQGYVTLGRQLEQVQRLSRRDVVALFRRSRETGEPIDVAAVRLQLLTAEAFADAVAHALRTERISLSREERLETTTVNSVDVTHRRLDDPVDHAVAQSISDDDAERLGALPVRREGDDIVVAMADPLDTAAIAVLRDRLGPAIDIRPATRADIREASLRAHGRAALGDLLLDAGLITRDQLRTALEVVDRTGVRIGEALISLGALSEDEMIETLARQRGLPFFAVRGLDLDPAVLRLLPDEFARRHSMVPIMVDDDDSVTIAMEDPNDLDGMREAEELLEGRRVTFGLTTRADVRDALERVYHQAYLEHSAASLMQATPDESAYKVVTGAQKVFLIGTASFIVISLILFTIQTLIVLLALSTTFYLAFSSYKFYLIYRALSHTLEVPITEEMIGALEDRDLPIYTILVPLYRETAVLPILVRGLSRMDYPKEKLDVKLLLEEDDVETIAVARLSNLPPYFDITIVPDGQPKGKPKACNYGLLHARGKFVVIFDAEDIPEPDQLKKVLVAFAMAEPNVVCVQTKLNYYNRNQNALTKWFTTEYSTWFDLFLPGLDASGAPIPLGGTSNHFRLDALQAAGGWDPFNVTEDADLGLRIFKLGGRTAVVDSTTYEEANSVLDNWIRQRSRWVKGYIQTYLVHMRHPIKLLRALGLGGFISFQLVIGGTFFGFLLNPLLWGLTGVWFATKWSVIEEVFPGPVYYMGAISLYVGNFAFAYMNVAGCLRRRYYSLVKWALLSPVYWVLMSIAAWKGFLQLFYRPFYWEKTIHGLADHSVIEDISKLSAEHK